MGDIEVPFGYSVPGLATPANACSYPYMGFSISEGSDDVAIGGSAVNDNSAFPSGAYTPTWKSMGIANVKDNGYWNKSNKLFVKQNGVWDKSNSQVVQRSFYNKLKFTLCGGGDSDHGGYSYKNWIMPNRYIIPAGYYIDGIRFAARYDVICDGVFLAQSQGLANALGNAGGKRDALVLCSRRSAGYIGGTSVPGTVESPGPQPSAFRWTIPSWAAHQYPFSNGGNMMALNLWSRWDLPYRPNGGVMCSGVSGPTFPIRLSIPSTYTLPFPIDMIISIRYSSSCGGKNRYCNHYLCDGTLQFRSPYTRIQT
jgi:hypothetical protein